MSNEKILVAHVCVTERANFQFENELSVQNQGVI